MKKKHQYRRDIFDFDETKKTEFEEFLKYAKAVIKTDHEQAELEKEQEKKRFRR